MRGRTGLPHIRDSLPTYQHATTATGFHGRISKQCLDTTARVSTSFATGLYLMNIIYFRQLQTVFNVLFSNPAKIPKSAGVRPVTMETRCFHQKLEFQRYQPKIPVPLAMSANLRRTSFKLFKNPEKSNSWADLGLRSA